MAGGVAGVEFGCILAGDDQFLPLFVIPAEGGDVVVVAVHDAGLAGRGLRRNAAVDPAEREAVLLEHLLERRHQPRGDGGPDVVEAKAVDLHHHQAATRYVGALESLFPGRALDIALVERSLVVDFQDTGEDDIDGRKEDAAEDRREDAADREAGQQPGSDVQGDGVDEKADDEKRDETQRTREQEDQRPDQEVDDAEEERGRKCNDQLGRASGALQCEAWQQCRGRPQR